MKEFKQKLQALIEEHQSKDGISNKFSYIIIAGFEDEENSENGHLFSALYGSHKANVNAALEAIRTDKNLKKIFLDAFMVDILSGSLSKAIGALAKEFDPKEKECECERRCKGDNEGCSQGDPGPGTCEE